MVVDQNEEVVRMRRAAGGMSALRRARIVSKTCAAALHVMVHE